MIIPTQEGWYFVREDYFPLNNKTTIHEGVVEIVRVALSHPPRTRNLSKPKVMMVFGRHWSCRLSEVSPLWRWEKIPDPTFKEGQ